jgi:glycosyltransferase involved in cell wall biosynthesis
LLMVDGSDERQARRCPSINNEPSTINQLMRILYLSPSPFLAVRHAAGWGTHMREVVRALEAQGHALRVVTGEGPVTEMLTTPAPGMVRRVVPRPLKNLRREGIELRHDRDVLQRAKAAALEFGPDVVYERTAILHLAGMRLARSLRVPLIVEQNSPQVEERIELAGMALAPLARRMERQTYRAADAVVTVSSVLKEYAARMGAPADRTHVVPNGARPDLFDPAKADGAMIREQLDLPAKAVVAGFVGAFADWHGLDRLVHAFALAQGDAQTAFYLLLVGDGPHRPALEALARDLGVLQWVIFSGPVPFERVPHYLAAMDIAVMPSSNWYGSPIKIFEYGAMGRAVIGPGTPPVREVMLDGEEGLIVPPGDVEGLRAALARLASNRLLREQLGERFRERVLREYTWDHVASRLAAICDDALGRRGTTRLELSGVRREA